MGEMILHKIMKQDRIHFDIDGENKSLGDIMRSVLHCRWDGLRTYKALLDIETLNGFLTTLREYIRVKSVLRSSLKYQDLTGHDLLVLCHIY